MNNGKIIFEDYIGNNKVILAKTFISDGSTKIHLDSVANFTFDYFSSTINGFANGGAFLKIYSEKEKISFSVKTVSFISTKKSQ